MTQDILELGDQLTQAMTQSWKAQAIYVTATLGLADLLAEGPASSTQLAAGTGAHEPSLQRLLKSLTTLGLLTEAGGLFALTPTGGLLRKGVEGSMHHWALWWGDNLWKTWGHLLHSVQSGRSGREKLGTSGFRHLDNSQAEADIFHQAMAELSWRAAESIVPAYDFSGFSQIIDVGGGTGELLCRVLKAHPGLSGRVFDQPHAQAAAVKKIADEGLSSRCSFESGDFFQKIPGGADAVLLKSVLHDWTEEQCLVILRRCREAASPASRLLIVERMLPDRWTDSPRHQDLMRCDLTMLVAHGAGEKTEGQYRSLLQAAGFRTTRLVPAGPDFSILEAEPV